MHNEPGQPDMCYYRFYIFVGCGHSLLSSKPIKYCEDAQEKVVETTSTATTRSVPKNTTTTVTTAQRYAEVQVMSDTSTTSRTVQLPPTPTTPTFTSKSTFPPLPLRQTQSNSFEQPPLTPPLSISGVEGLLHPTNEPTTPTTPTTTIITQRQACDQGTAHPMHTTHLERLCAVCDYEAKVREQKRKARLDALRVSALAHEIKFDPARWKWKYQGGK